MHKNPNRKITEGGACIAPDEDAFDAPDEDATAMATNTARGPGPAPVLVDIAPVVAAIQGGGLAIGVNWDTR
jgi:hypothetical protein